MIMASWQVRSIAMPDTPPVQFNIPQQSLSAALHRLALQANREMLFEADTVADLVAPAVVGLMSAEAALRKLLTGTSLEFVEDDSGAIIVRRRVSRPSTNVKHAPRKAPEPAVAAVVDPPVAQPVVAAEPARIEAGNWIARFRSAYFHPANESDAFATTGPRRQTVRPNDITTTDRWFAEVDLEYLLNGHWSSELALDLPRSFDLQVRNSARPAGPGVVGTFKQMPVTWTFKYNFAPDSTWRPYVGAGISATVFSDQDTNPYGLKSISVGPALQAGIDVRLNDRWFLNADIKWARIRPDFRLLGTEVSTLRMDPLICGVGIGYRFGASVPAPRGSHRAAHRTIEWIQGSAACGYCCASKRGSLSTHIEMDNVPRPHYGSHCGIAPWI
jgi:outer membrane protein